jgi:hypothetical protein
MNDKISIYDYATGEVIVREMTDEEQAQRDAEVAAYQAEQQAKEQQEAELRANKIAAYQKLGLTEAEIEALLPTPQPIIRN